MCSTTEVIVTWSPSPYRMGFTAFGPALSTRHATTNCSWRQLSVCGICGKVYLDSARRVEPNEIIAMRDTMRTRGPDAGGIHLDRHAALGHRRLSVIDLEASAQPMSNESGTV